MKKTRNDSPAKDRIVSSAGKAGIGWIDYIANRHYRTPPDPQFWQGLVAAAAGSNEAKSEGAA
jgi:hypothetical protein